MGGNCLPIKTSNLADQLFRELSHYFRLKTVNLDLGKKQLELIKVADLDELMEGITEADQIPFWAELWPASVGLARYIFNNSSLLQGCSIRELVAGLGLAGIAARLAGADLLQTDYAEAALQFIRINSFKNGLTEPRLLLADWRSFPKVDRFDLIMGADILYEKTLHQDLAKVITNSIKPGGTVWLADPGRDYAIDFVLFFMDQGWLVQQIRVPVAYEKNTYQIDIYRLQSKGNRE